MSLRADVDFVLGRLDRERLPHMLVGGLALEALGMPRSTLDVDLQVALPHPPSMQEPTFLGCFIEERTRDRVFDQDVLIVHRPTSGVPIEVFIATHWFTRQALDRRRPLPSALLGRVVPLPTAEDFVLLKLANMKQPGRPHSKLAQDEIDVQTVLDRAGPKLDGSYLRSNAAQLSVVEPLERFLRT